MKTISKDFNTNLKCGFSTSAPCGRLTGFSPSGASVPCSPRNGRGEAVATGGLAGSFLKQPAAFLLQKDILLKLSPTNQGRDIRFPLGLPVLFSNKRAKPKREELWGRSTCRLFSSTGRIFRFLPEKGARLSPHGLAAAGPAWIYVPALMSSPETLFIASGRSHFRNRSPWGFERSLEPSGQSRF